MRYNVSYKVWFFFNFRSIISKGSKGIFSSVQAHDSRSNTWQRQYMTTKHDYHTINWTFPLKAHIMERFHCDYPYQSWNRLLYWTKTYTDHNRPKIDQHDVYFFLWLCHLYTDWASLSSSEAGSTFSRLPLPCTHNSMRRPHRDSEWWHDANNDARSTSKGCDNQLMVRDAFRVGKSTNLATFPAVCRRCNIASLCWVMQSGKSRNRDAVAATKSWVPLRWSWAEPLVKRYHLSECTSQTAARVFTVIREVKRLTRKHYGCRISYTYGLNFVLASTWMDQIGNPKYCQHLSQLLALCTLGVLVTSRIVYVWVWWSNAKERYLQTLR